MIDNLLFLLDSLLEGPTSPVSHLLHETMDFLLPAIHRDGPYHFAPYVLLSELDGIPSNSIQEGVYVPGGRVPVPDITHNITTDYIPQQTSQAFHCSLYSALHLSSDDVYDDRFFYGLSIFLVEARVEGARVRAILERPE